MTKIVFTKLQIRFRLMPLQTSRPSTKECSVQRTDYKYIYPTNNSSVKKKEVNQKEKNEFSWGVPRASRLVFFVFVDDSLLDVNRLFHRHWSPSRLTGRLQQRDTVKYMRISDRILHNHALLRYSGTCSDKSSKCV